MWSHKGQVLGPHPRDKGPPDKNNFNGSQEAAGWVRHSRLIKLKG